MESLFEKECLQIYLSHSTKVAHCRNPFSPVLVEEQAKSKHQSMLYHVC